MSIKTKHFYFSIDLETNTEDGGESDGHQRHGLHPPHEPAGGQPEQAVRRGAGVQEPVEPLQEHLLLLECSDGDDARHGGGDVVDDGGLQLVVQPLGLLHPVVHRPVDHDNDQDDGHEGEGEPGDVEAGQQNLKCLYCSSIFIIQRLLQPDKPR